MGISKIGSLFAANVDSVSTKPQNSNTQDKSAQTAASSQKSSEAVVFASTLGRASAPTESVEDRSARLAALKAQVTSGSYKPDTSKVALSVFRDLA